MDEFRFQNLSFEFADGSPKILDNVDFTFPQGKDVLLVGKSGSGRSTILRLLAGLLMPTSGKYWIDDREVSDMSFEEFLPLRQQIGYSFDFGGLMANRTLKDNLLLPLMYHQTISAEEAFARVNDLIKRFGLQKGQDQRPASVSGGMRKACVVARAFVLKPQAIFLDDPFVALDQANIDEVFNLIAELRAEGSLRHVFLTSREMEATKRIPFISVEVEEGKLRVREDLRLQKVAGL